MRESVKQYVHACFLQSDQIEAIGEYIEPRGATGIDLQKSISFFLTFNFYWNIVGLQCCVAFCSTAKQFSHMYTYILSFSGGVGSFPFSSPGSSD